MRKNRRAGFTLIELLIVVAILTILAALAAENYLAAQIRTRVSRVRADMRTLSVGIESYHVDHSVYPRMAHWRYYKDPAFDIIQGEKCAGVLSRALSTPVAYVSNPQLFDPFMETNKMAPLDERLYTYQVIDVYQARQPSSSFWSAARQFFGGWRLMGVGPDRRFDHNFANSAQLPYDPTNGLISLGNLWYSPGGTEDRMPPVPLLLREH